MPGYDSCLAGCVPSASSDQPHSAVPEGFVTYATRGRTWVYCPTAEHASTDVT
jgi:hypothetical protein